MLIGITINLMAILICGISVILSICEQKKGVAIGFFTMMLINFVFLIIGLIKFFVPYCIIKI